jgi:hypothetical protein
MENKNEYKVTLETLAGYGSKQGWLRVDKYQWVTPEGGTVICIPTYGSDYVQVRTQIHEV